MASRRNWSTWLMTSSETFSPLEEEEDEDDEGGFGGGASSWGGSRWGFEERVSFNRFMDSSKSATSHDSGAPRSSAEPSIEKLRGEEGEFGRVRERGDSSEKASGVWACNPRSLRREFHEMIEHTLGLGFGTCDFGIGGAKWLTRRWCWREEVIGFDDNQGRRKHPPRVTRNHNDTQQN